ncbi:MAG: hypothetical protein GYB66_14635 [Chloroflexi bacterium]|nr:hypothetical protein [Chloroflexota bacterium]
MSEVAILIGVFAAAIIGYAAMLPILAERQIAGIERKRYNRQHDLDELQARFHRLIESVLDLDFDYDMGKVTPEVYVEQRKMLIGRSVSALIQLDKAEAQWNRVDQEIEQVIANYRGDGTSPRADHVEAVDGEIEAMITARRQKAVQG